MVTVSAALSGKVVADGCCQTKKGHRHFVCRYPISLPTEWGSFMFKMPVPTSAFPIKFRRIRNAGGNYWSSGQ